jgi:hypothetical protein
MRQRWEAFANRMKSLGEISVIVFMLLPLSLAVAGIAFASVAYQGLLVMNLLGLPVLGFMFTIIVIGSVPKVYDIYEPPKFLFPLALLAGIGAGVAGYIVASSFGAKALPIAFAAGAGAASATVWLMMRNQVQEVFSSNSLSAYDMNRRNGAAAARLHMFMAFLFPAIALIATSMILAMAGQLISLAEAQQQVRFATPAELERVVEMAWLSVAEASIILTIAISRAMDLSFYNLWRVAVVSMFLIAAVVIQPMVMHQLAGFLMPQSPVGG